MFRREKASIIPRQAVNNTLLLRLLKAMGFDSPKRRGDDIVASKNGAIYTFFVSETDSVIMINSAFPIRSSDAASEVLSKVNNFNNISVVVKAAVYYSEADSKPKGIRFMSDMHFTNGLVAKNLLHRMQAFESVMVMTDHPLRSLMGGAP